MEPTRKTPRNIVAATAYAQTVANQHLQPAVVKKSTTVAIPAIGAKVNRAAAIMFDSV